MTAPSATHPVRVLIVDDEPLARAVLRRLIATLDDFVVAGECRDGREALAAVETLSPALIFLDVRMPELDGVGLVRAIRPLDLDQPPALVFVTAYDEFAVRAFEADAIDYLVKPFTDDRFHATIAKVRRFFEREGVFARYNNSNRPDEHAVDRSSLLVTIGGRSVVVPAASIDWVSADGYYSRLHVGHMSYLIRASLAELEQRLGADRFIRAHRGALVRVDRVCEVRRAARRCEIVLASGARISVSERRRSQLSKRLGAKG